MTLRVFFEKEVGGWGGQLNASEYDGIRALHFGYIK